ncbi:Multidrug resistance-associated protein 5 [Frankliniella fusca]|uniref:Multidrug resistance-associated protein 5 n=1 Tax=Frankliniella fusca TaxID=407009 RepID=A0AAE1HV30_9NEOP|nr:Multidrug resistance-associated protein 5 [Frankliniella fusca]
MAETGAEHHKWLSTGSLCLSLDGEEKKTDPYEEAEEDMGTTTRNQPIAAKKSNKYGPAMKHLLPYRKAPPDSQVMPGNSSGMFSYIAVAWMTKLMWKAYRRGLSEDDLYELHTADRAESNAGRLESAWHDRVRQQGFEASLFSVVWRFCRTRAIVATTLMVLAVIFQFMGPAILQRLILQYVEDKTQPLSWGLTLVGMLFATQLLRNYCFGAAYVMGLHTAIRIQGSIQHLVYKKMLLLRSGGERALGQVITFCTNEQERIFEAAHMGVLILGTPVMFTMCVTYSVWVLGPWALVGNLVILLFYPVMAGVASLTSMVRIKTVQVTDKRIGLMNEILSSIRLIKMYAWEDSFAKNICNVRDLERQQLQKAAFLQSFSNTITPSITILASIATFLGYSLTGNNLYTAEAFTVHAVFTAMQFTVGTLPYFIKCLAEARISCNKIQKFLQRPNFESTVTRNPGGIQSSGPVIDFKKATFIWDDEEPETLLKGATTPSRGNIPKVSESDPVNGVKNGKNPEESNKLFSDVDKTEVLEPLRNISLTVERGTLLGICGSVGAGKSSLLSAITGDMIRVHGEMFVQGSLALVSQQAWIFNETLRENILFGLPYDEERYKEVINVCSLQRDLEMLSNGDQTEIGERGTNLSGGQKQRVNLARAVYANKDVYLLDDPLSAVDARVARHIFSKCIKGTLKGKTILLVTHGLQFLVDCDEVVFLKDGAISEHGSHSELSKAAGDYSQMLTFDHARSLKKQTSADDTEAKNIDEEPPLEENGGKMTSAEEHKSLGFSGYLRYFVFCGGYFIMSLLLLLILLFTLARLFSGVWLQIWLDEGDGLEDERKLNMTLYNLSYTDVELKGLVNENPDRAFYQLVYGLTFGITILIGICKGWGIARQLLLGSSRLHDTMFRKIMRCPISFYDVTPTGRILQRFSKDMDELDVRIPYFFEFVWQGLMFCVTQMLLICFVFPIFSIALTVAAILFAFLDVWLNKGLKETKRLDNLRKSPVLNHITSTMSGLSVIRSFGRQRIFLERFCARLNHSLASDLIYRSSVRWFTFRMDMIAVVMVTLTGFVVVYFRGTVTTAESGLALSCVFAVCTFIPYVMQLKSEFQSRFTSAERVLEYSSDLPEEAPKHIDQSPKPNNWPDKGDIKMENVELRYRPGLPLVLQSVSAHIQGGEKIGVVGRTGAGKSSLISTFLRLTELAGGRILIDDVDISLLGLQELRSAIAIIPQDPVLFEGTLRFNLDPFGEHKDEKIWEALEKSHLKDKLSREEKQLQTPVSAAGQNLSVGEKQLICLARAVLRQNKILLLDEATASVDVETDFLIQSTIRETFKDCTVVTIAHRLHTVSSYDRVMVMDAGKVIEFDTPVALRANRDSVFNSMLEAAGVAYPPSSPDSPSR